MKNSCVKRIGRQAGQRVGADLSSLFGISSGLIWLDCCPPGGGLGPFPTCRNNHPGSAPIHPYLTTGSFSALSGRSPRSTAITLDIARSWAAA